MKYLDVDRIYCGDSREQIMDVWGKNAGLSRK